MNEQINQLELSLVPDVETKLLPDGTRLMKQTRRAEYVALDSAQQWIIDQFADARRVQDVLHQFLLEGPHPDIRSFYDLVSYCLDCGFLVETGAASAGDDARALRGRKWWGAAWGFWPALASFVFFVPLGFWLLIRSEPVMPEALGGWLAALLLVTLILSLANLAKGCVLSGLGRLVYAPRVGWHLGIPCFSIDTRDAFMGGRRCQAGVAFQAITVPFVVAAFALVGESGLGSFAAILAVIAVTSPFGSTPAHDLLHALFRKAYQLPRCPATFLGRRVFQHLFFGRRSSSEEEYLMLYSAYAVVWLGSLIWFGAGLVGRQGNVLVQNVIFAPDALSRLLAMVVLAFLVALLLAPIAYQVWFFVHNAYALVAPYWFKAETRVRRKPAGERPALDSAVQFLRGIPLFSKLADDEVAATAEAMAFTRVAGGTTIIREGDMGDSLFVLYSGGVDVSKEDEAGVERAIASLNEGDVFGEIALLDNVPRTASVRAVGQVELFALARDGFEKLLVASLGTDEIKTLIQICSFLKRNALFSAWPDKALMALAHDFEFVDFGQDQVLIRENEENDSFFILHEGEVEIRRHGTPCGVLSTGDFFGEISLLRGVPAVADVVVTTPGRGLRLSRDRFLEFISQDLRTGVTVEGILESRLTDEHTQ